MGRGTKGGERIITTPEDHAVLAQQDMETLANWWCDLNAWKWPPELPNPEAPIHSPEGGEGRRKTIMAWIEEQVGHRVISRHWNKDMTDEQHEDFWRGCFEGNIAAMRRHQKRTTDHIKDIVESNRTQQK